MADQADIQHVIDIVIENERKAAAAYRSLALKVDLLKPDMFYTPHRAKISWSADVGFYKELEQEVLGSESNQNYYQALPPKVGKDDSLNFYRSLGDTFTENVQAIFHAMATEEDHHAESFSKILRKLHKGTSPQNSETFDDQIVYYLENYPKDAGINTDIRTPNSILTALQEAIASEQHAVQFYCGMVPYASPAAAELLGIIIKEERGHLAKLKAQLKSYTLLVDEH
jgi:rubrerythrin